MVGYLQQIMVGNKQQENMVGHQQPIMGGYQQQIMVGNKQQQNMVGEKPPNGVRDLQPMSVYLMQIFNPKSILYFRQCFNYIKL